ncbi:MAG TPA: SRPBCC family protein [Planctomycetota bacterium]|nr:SRPBCC family protein [Planctomycetota bacterium]
MVKKVLLALLALIVVLVLLGTFLSQHYEHSRSVVIQAPPEKIFPLIGDLKAWPAWEPFSKEEPEAKITLGEKTTGVGASQSWIGKTSGHFTFTECDPKTGIAYDLIFVNGERESPAKSWIHMNPRPDGSTEVVWGINGEMNMPVIGGYFAKFSDRMMGPIFERGLEQLKVVAEQK